MISGAASAPLFGRLNPNCISVSPLCGRPARPCAQCAATSGDGASQKPPGAKSSEFRRNLAAQRALQFALVHPRSAGDVAALRLGVKLGLGLVAPGAATAVALRLVLVGLAAAF